MNSKILHPSALHHFSNNNIGICDSGVHEFIQKTSPSLNNNKDATMIEKDVYILGSGSGKWSQSEHVLNWHITKFSTDTSPPYIQKIISEIVILRKIEGYIIPY